MPVPETDLVDDLPAFPPQAPRLETSGQRDSSAATPSSPPVNHPSLPLEQDPRPGDDGLGHPIQAPKELTPLTENDRQKIRAMEATALEKEMREFDEAISGETNLGGIPSLLGGPLAGALMLGMASLLAIFLFNQVVTTLALVSGLPPVWRYMSWLALTVLAGAVLYSIARLGGMYYRLRRNRQIRLQGLEELERRTHLRWLVDAKRQEAFEQMKQYVMNFSLDDLKHRKRLTALGFDGITLVELEKTRVELLDPNRWANSAAWFTTFQQSFLARVDAVANQRISYWARRAALTTAISPNSLADTALTMYYSFSMMGDLCALYNLRAGRMATAVILTRVFFNSYVAGQINQMEDLTADQLQELIAPHLPVTELVLAKVAGKLGAKAGTAAVNFFLLKRLGKFGIRVLQPMRASG